MQSRQNGGAPLDSRFRGNDLFFGDPQLLEKPNGHPQAGGDRIANNE